MNKKPLAGLAPLLATAAFALIPATAQALEPHWFEGGVELEPGAAHTVVPAVSGILKFSWGGKQRFACVLADEEELWNPLVGPGEDAIISIAFPKCKTQKKYFNVCRGKRETFEVKAEPPLPWKSRLTEPLEIRDEIEGIHLVVKCSANGFSKPIEGSVTPLVGDNFLEFGGGTGTLLYNGTEVVTINKRDKFKAAGGKITAELS